MKALRPDHIPKHRGGSGLLMQVGDLEAATPLYEEALEIRRNHYADDHSLLVSSLNNLGRLRILLDEPEPAQSLLEEGWAMAHRLAANAS